MSYFKYAERSSESRVDWNEISKGMVDMLKEQTRLRNEKLDDAVKLQGEVTTTLSEAPMGSDVNANQRVSEFAADAQEYSLMMNKLWRSGQMSYREYMAATNNFKTNTEGYLSQAEKYAANYEVHVKRMEEQLASGVEVSELARVEDFGNFSKFTPVIDAPTGSIGLVGEDGRKYASVTQLGVAVMSQYDRLDVEGRTTDVAKQMGTTVEVLKAGDVRTLESALQNDDYVAAEDDAVSGILIGDNAHTSVLVDFKRGLYSTTHDINDAINDPNAILMVPSSRNPDRMIGAIEDDAAFERYIDEQATRDGQPLTDGEKAILRKNREAQREQAFETVREQLRARLPFKETPTAEFAPPPPARLSAAERGKYAETQSGLESLAKVFYGDKKLRQEGLDEVFGQDETITSYGVRETADGGQEIFVQQMRDDGTVVERTPIPLGEKFRQFAKPAGTQFFEAAYIDDVLPGILKKYEGRERGSGEYTTTRQPIVTDISNVEITYRDEKKSVKDVLAKAGGVPRLGRALGTRTDAEEEAQIIRTVLGAPEVGINATVASVDERTIEKARGESAAEGTVTAPGVQVFVEGRMDKPVIIPNTPSSMGALTSVVDLLAKNRFITADELLALLPEEAKAYNDPRVIASIFTEEVTEETPSYDWASAGQ
ncbi:hypothetical protein [Limnobacter sp.]|uniref:hypothetical protein n=1 Tax=Limnobacter sp. TaxID=2003368 RepID=UPI0025BC42E7|nr:hypothetical protein [Limnobacter sp.]